MPCGHIPSAGRVSGFVTQTSALAPICSVQRRAYGQRSVSQWWQQSLWWWRFSIRKSPSLWLTMAYGQRSVQTQALFLGDLLNSLQWGVTVTMTWISSVCSSSSHHTESQQVDSKSIQSPLLSLFAKVSISIAFPFGHFSLNRLITAPSFNKSAPHSDASSGYYRSGTTPKTSLPYKRDEQQWTISSHTITVNQLTDFRQSPFHLTLVYWSL